MSSIPTERDILEHVISINCRVKGNCRVHRTNRTPRQASDYCRRCTHNKNGSKMQDNYIPILQDLHYF